MKVCNEIKRRIDEADKPDQLSLEISRHTAQCADCRTFGNERAELRDLLASGARVSVPVNFDAVLNARLAEVKAPKSFAWLSPAYLRFGAATAMLAVMVFAAQRSDLFSTEYQALAAASVSLSPDRSGNPEWISRAATPGSSAVEPSANQSGEHVLAAYHQGPRINVRQRGRAVSAPVEAENYFSPYEGGVILVRGQNGEREVTVPTVSIGAQPLFYSSRPAQAVRSVSTSF